MQNSLVIYQYITEMVKPFSAYVNVNVNIFSAL